MFDEPESPPCSLTRTEPNAVVLMRFNSPLEAGLSWLQCLPEDKADGIPAVQKLTRSGEDSFTTSKTTLCNEESPRRAWSWPWRKQDCGTEVKQGLGLEQAWLCAQSPAVHFMNRARALPPRCSSPSIEIWSVPSQDAPYLCSPTAVHCCRWLS